MFIIQLNHCAYSLYVTSSLTRGWVCILQLLLVLVSAVILRSESRGTNDHILFSQIRDSPNLQGQVPVFISPQRTGWAGYTPRHWVPFPLPPTTRRATVELSDPASTRDLWGQSQSYVMTDGQSASLSWNKAPIWVLRPDLYYCQTVAGLLMWGSLSDERTYGNSQLALLITYRYGPRQKHRFSVAVQLLQKYTSWRSRYLTTAGV
jgi:hypothetical protein